MKINVYVSFDFEHVVSIFSQKQYNRNLIPMILNER